MVNVGEFHPTLHLLDVKMLRFHSLPQAQAETKYFFLLKYRTKNKFKLKRKCSSYFMLVYKINCTVEKAVLKILSKSQWSF